jgi:hypothetical protein
MSDSFVSSIARIFIRNSEAKAESALPTRYGLDNAAIIMPPGINDVCTSLFHLSADMDAPVDVERLQLALERTAKRFPYIDVELNRGFFWYHFSPATARLAVEPEPESPCLGFNPNRRHTRLYRVRASGNRIVLEMSHLVADGKGGMRFIKTLVAEYCRLCGSPALEPHPDVYDVNEAPSPEEFEDAYVRYYRPGLPLPVMPEPAFRVVGELLPKGDYRITTGRFPVADIHSVAKARGVTIMELMAAIYVEALQTAYLETPPRLRKYHEIAVEIPIDMRRFHPTATNRNFTLFAIVGEDMRLGPRDFDDLLERLKCRFRVENDEPTIAQQISRNVHGMNHPAVRAIPLPLKDVGARILFSVLGEKYVSAVVTNLGTVDFPRGVAEHVTRFDLAQPPAVSTKANVAIHSHNGVFYVTVCSLLSEPKMEKLVFQRIERLGIKARIECNLPERP